MIKSRYATRLLCRLFVVVACIALLDRKSDAFLIGNLIGCNSFGCRLTNLENEVANLKQQVVRLGGDPGMGMNHGLGMGGGMNQFRPNLNQNPAGNQNLNGLQGNGQQGSGQQGANNANTSNQGNQNQPNNRVSYANYDYPTGPNELRRVQNYPTGNQQLQSQFF